MPRPRTRTRRRHAFHGRYPPQWQSYLRRVARSAVLDTVRRRTAGKRIQDDSFEFDPSSPLPRGVRGPTRWSSLGARRLRRSSSTAAVRCRRASPETATSRSSAGPGARGGRVERSLGAWAAASPRREWTACCIGCAGACASRVSSAPTRIGEPGSKPVEVRLQGMVELAIFEPQESTPSRAQGLSGGAAGVEGIRRRLAGSHREAMQRGEAPGIPQPSSRRRSGACILSPTPNGCAARSSAAMASSTRQTIHFRQEPFGRARGRRTRGSRCAFVAGGGGRPARVAVRGGRSA